MKRTNNNGKIIGVIILVAIAATMMVNWLESVIGIANLFYGSTLIVFLVGAIYVPIMQYRRSKGGRSC
jgi:hypothetical protein